jgi:P-type E1-E2 ATPase
LIKKNTKG